MSSISIVVPVYHNAESLPALLKEFQKIAEVNSKHKFLFIFVDDGSKDKSLEILKSLLHRESRMRILKLSRNFGSTAAILAGLSCSNEDVTVVIAADLQDPPHLITKMLKKWMEGSKVVLASRKKREDPLSTVIAAKIFYSLFRKYAVSAMPEGGFDFFLVDRQVRELINNIPENNTYLMGLILWLGFNPEIIYYVRRDRKEIYGHSMWTFTKKLKHFIDSFVAFSYFPLRASSFMGIILSFIGIFYAIFIIILRIFLGINLEGWTSLMVVLLVVSGAQLIMMGILGEYLWRNLDETRRRPRYIIESVIEKNKIKKS